MTNKYKSFKTSLHYTSVLSGVILATSLTLMSAPAMAQNQAGSVTGRIVDANGNPIAGVTVEASSNVLPTPRVTTSSANGNYRFLYLIPGHYTFTFKAPDGSMTTREADVLLQQKIRVDTEMGVGGDQVIVTGQRMNVDTGHASLKSSLGQDAIEGVPVGQDYRDILKLIPGVQYSEDTTRGPSAGGHGQDNIYQIDGVDVTLPLFGTLSSEPSNQDVAQVSIIRGGAKAIGFVRAGGFQINSVSKRGTNEFHGEVGYQIQTSGLTAGQVSGTSIVKSETDLDWLTANIGGPVIKDKLFFYTSYYRPTVTSKNKSNARGDVPDYTSKRNEYYGKLTFTPNSDMLLDVSYRTSDRATHNSGIGAYDDVSTSEGSDASQDIITAEGNWNISDNSNLSFKFTDYTLKTASRPDTLFDFPIHLGDSLNIADLASQGLVQVPVTNGDPAHDAFVQPFIDQYGVDVDGDGIKDGVGQVGGATTINNQDFFRTSYEVAYDKSVEVGDMTHNFHIGYQRQKIAEDLNRLSNGFGYIEIPAGTVTANDGVTPVYFIATLNQMSVIGANGTTVVPDKIHSESVLQSFEINDTIESGKWTVDVGVVVSKDTFYGQGLKEDPTALSGYIGSPGTKYKMHETKWRNMIQPRFGVRYDKSDRDSFYANFARYNPPASSLARAASWDRNLARTIRMRFDQNGNFIDIDPERASSGKLFQEGIKPRYTNEYLVGWDHQVNDNLAINLYVRHRESGNFWEDTWNWTRVYYSDVPDNIPHTPYIPQLNDYRNQIGSGSSYVIAQLDGAYTKYWDAGLMASYRTDNMYLNASYTWSRYRGNFDQDNTTTNNDANTFIGSSFLADGRGRQIWNNRDGILRGDRPHMFKLFGFYELPWKGRVGGYANYQSGQPWEIWDGTVYGYPASSRYDTSRYAEPAGSRRTKAHFQLDLNYTQFIKIAGDYEIELRADLFNVFNSQTGYNINPKKNTFSDANADLRYQPRSRYRPRRLQISAKARF